MSSTAVRKIKLSSVTSQVDDTEVLLAEETEMVKAFATSTCSMKEQCLTRYDLWGIWAGDHEESEAVRDHPGQRRGNWNSRVRSTSKFALWLSSYTVLLVMLETVDLGNLLRCRNLIERIHATYGERVWSVIYQGDVRCRLEHVCRC